MTPEPAGLPSAAHSGQTPLRTLAAFHQRLREQCAILLRLSRQARDDSAPNNEVLDKPADGGLVDAKVAHDKAVHGKTPDARAAHDSGGASDARAAAASLIRFFDEDVPKHHRDEELDLFPALIESMAASDAGCLHEITRSLAVDHRWLESAWSGLKGALVSITQGGSTALDAAAVEALVTRYREHLQREDLELLPMAERLVDDHALAQMGESMRSRANVDRA